MNYTKVLNPTQCEEMSRFLSILSACGRKAAERGIKPDIGEFIAEWRGHVSTDEVREYNRNRHRRRKAALCK